MTGEELLQYCLAKPGAWPDEPWEGDTVAKVGTADATASAYIGRHGRNTLRLGGAIPDDASYDAVVATLPKKNRPVPE